MWEEAKRKGDDAIRRLIDDGLIGTTVTAVLIGWETWARRWVNYEIERSLARGNGLVGVFIHQIRDQYGRPDLVGRIPQLLIDRSVPCYQWDRTAFSGWVETAALNAGHPCLGHGARRCQTCMGIPALRF